MDQDVWIQPATKADDTEYYEYTLCYVDDILACSTDPPEVIMDTLQKTYLLKKDSVKEPDSYLGADVTKYCIDGSDNPGKPRWAMSSDNKYAKQACHH